MYQQILTENANKPSNKKVIAKRRNNLILLITPGNLCIMCMIYPNPINTKGIVTISIASSIPSFNAFVNACASNIAEDKVSSLNSLKKTEYDADI